MSAIEAFVTNLGRYNEGVLDGEFLKLPATTEEVQALFQRIHVDGVRYEEIFITDYETNISGLYDCLPEYADLDELNYLAALLDDLDEGDREKFEAALSYGEYTDSLKDLINLAQNLDCYEYYPGICDEDDLGRYMIDEMGAMEVPEYLENYIDYEAYGRDVSLEDGAPSPKAAISWTPATASWSFTTAGTICRMNTGFSRTPNRRNPSAIRSNSISR